MLRHIAGLTLLGTLAFRPSLCAAQEQRQPHQGSQAVGLEVGAFVPSDGQFQNNLLLDGLFEYYVQPRISLRAAFGWTDPGHQREPVDSLRQVALRLDVNYNWEGGVWHPFVGAGVGAYFLRNKDNGRPFGDTMVEPGVNFQAGAEYFFTRTMTLKGEARYHRIDTPTGGPDPSGWAITAGLTRYF